MESTVTASEMRLLTEENRGAAEAAKQAAKFEEAAFVLQALRGCIFSRARDGYGFLKEEKPYNVALVLSNGKTIKQQLEDDGFYVEAKDSVKEGLKGFYFANFIKWEDI